MDIKPIRKKLEEDPYRLMYEIDGLGPFPLKSRDIAEKIRYFKNGY